MLHQHRHLPQVVFHRRCNDWILCQSWLPHEVSCFFFFFQQKTSFDETRHRIKYSPQDGSSTMVSVTPNITGKWGLSQKRASWATLSHFYIGQCRWKSVDPTYCKQIEEIAQWQETLQVWLLLIFFSSFFFFPEHFLLPGSYCHYLEHPGQHFFSETQTLMSWPLKSSWWMQGKTPSGGLSERVSHGLCVWSQTWVSRKQECLFCPCLPNSTERRIPGHVKSEVHLAYGDSMVQQPPVCSQISLLLPSQEKRWRQ